MSKRKPHFSPSVRTREAAPHAKKTTEGVVMLCPFCNPPHAINPGQPNACGVTLRVTAVQEIVGARTVRQEKLTCIKCGESGHGEMVRYFGGFLHLEECNPEVKLLTEIPEYSKWAARVFGLPESLRSVVEKFTGVVQVVHGKTPEGEETGEVEGYFFDKAQEWALEEQKAV